jgi:mevalonate kinase
MPTIFGKAPGKIILFGEHAVVFGQPAIAIPIRGVKAIARVQPNLTGKPGQVHIQAPDIHLDTDLSGLPHGHPLHAAVRLVLDTLHIPSPPPLNLQITSTIPIASGMGSGAAVSIAVIRALSAFLGGKLSPEIVSELAFEIEKIHHGTPSGIDNTVISTGQPVYFIKGCSPETFRPAEPFDWLIADTGIQTPTRETVADVRRAWQAAPEPVESLFSRIGALTRNAREALEEGQRDHLGILLNENQALLRQLQVSHPALEALIQAALDAGALGAKLSGGGRGGNMIALIPPGNASSIRTALEKAGAKRIIASTLGKREVT